MSATFFTRQLHPRVRPKPAMPARSAHAQREVDNGGMLIKRIQITLKDQRSSRRGSPAQDHANWNWQHMLAQAGKSPARMHVIEAVMQREDLSCPLAEAGLTGRCRNLYGWAQPAITWIIEGELLVSARQRPERWNWSNILKADVIDVQIGEPLATTGFVRPVDPAKNLPVPFLVDRPGESVNWAQPARAAASRCDRLDACQVCGEHISETGYFAGSDTPYPGRNDPSVLMVPVMDVYPMHERCLRLAAKLCPHLNGSKLTEEQGGPIEFFSAPMSDFPRKMRSGPLVGHVPLDSCTPYDPFTRKTR